ncbi:hypothetical protein [Undibacterium parvum]|nr:hypothetical protein [Undibacterium parvum]
MTLFTIFLLITFTVSRWKAMLNLGFESLLLNFYATPVRFARQGDGHI